MSDAVAVSPSDLVDGTSPVKKPLEWIHPDGTPVKITPAYPGCKTHGWHPLAKHMVSFKNVPVENRELNGTPFSPGRTFPAPSPAPQPAPAPEPQPAPQPAPVTDQGEQPGTGSQQQQAPPQSEPPPPNFSDLPGGSGATGAQQQQDANSAESNLSLAKTIWLMFVGLMCGIFGKEWQPVNDAEQNNVIEKIAAAFDYWAMRALNPVEQMWVAIGAYCFPRWMTVARWWKARVASKLRRDPAASAKQARTPDPEPQPAPAPDPPKPESGKIHPKHGDTVTEDFVG